VSGTGPNPETEPDDGLTEDEVREYVEKLRATPAQQLVVEMLFNAVNAAQVKLGRKDARLFIDLSALLVDRLSDHLPDEATSQVEQALHQLRLAQVQAEAQVAESGEPEPNDLDRAPTGIAPGGQTGTTGEAGPTSPSATSKLWVPGRDG
jgi:hypothetical protein